MDKYSRLSALKPARGAAPRPAMLRAPNEEDALAQLLGSVVARNRFGEHLSVRNWFSTPEFAEPSAITLDLLSRTRGEPLSGRARTALADPSKWLFLDTETTGLAGGTGTYAFLVGIAWWEAGGLEVEQFFMRDFAEEHSLLYELTARLADRPVLLTFNGKSFDWPLLESRFTMTRSIATPHLMAHFDLLHPARAIWKLRLGSVRLVDLERHVLDAPHLGWHRADDVPSSLIPQFYFDYLLGGPAESLVAVVRHNQMDLRGLAALFSKINTLLTAQYSLRHEIDGLDLFGLSRFLQRRGASESAQMACKLALDLGLPAEFRPIARRDLALLAKRLGDHVRAAALWHELVADSHDAAFACEQLAIHYERRAKDFARAAEFARLGLAKIKRTRTDPRDPYAATRLAKLAERFLSRINRLDHRIMRTKGVTALPLAGPRGASPAGGGNRGR